MTSAPSDLPANPARHYQHKVFDSGRWRGFAPRDGDILVCTSYKAGTTWMQMICAQLIFQGEPLDRPLAEISPWMDLKAAPAEEIHRVYDAQAHRRVIKTHTPLDGLPWLPQASYLVVVRDPRDIFISMLNHMQNGNPYADAIFLREAQESDEEPEPLPEDPNELFQLWLTESSFPWENDGFPYWSVFHHGETFWAERQRDNITLIHYGDLKADLAGEMRRIAGALSIEVPEARWPALVEAATFESMKRNADRVAPDTNFKMWKDNSQFFHKGTSGQWRGVLSPESLDLFDRVLAERYPPDFIAWLLGGAAARESA